MAKGYAVFKGRSFSRGREPRPDAPPRAYTTAKVGEVLEGKGGATEAGWHKIAVIHHCPQRYQYAFARGIVKPIAQQPEYYSVGTAFHAGKARWYASGFKTDDATWKSIVVAVEKALEEDKLPASMNAQQRALTLLQQYISYWSIRPAPKPRAVEYKLGPAPVRPDDPFYLYRTAKLDDLSEYPEAAFKLMIGETKTTSDSIAAVVAEYTLHGQTMLQRVLYDMCPNGLAKYGPVGGIMLDIIKKPDSRKDEAKFARVPIFISEFQMKWFRDQLVSMIRVANGIDWDSTAPRLGYWNGCNYKAGRKIVECEYKPLCRLGPDGTTGFVLADGKPLKQHKPEPGRTKMPWE